MNDVLSEKDKAFTIPSRRDSRGRYRGLDTIRGLAAAVVVLDHIELFNSQEHFAHIPDSLVRSIGVIWNGPAAVIVFFIISGFCIHLPYRGSRPIELGPYFARRLVRVGLPAAIAFSYSAFFFHARDFVSTFNAFSILWSVLCELIYYFLYPLLRKLSFSFSWVKMILVSYLGSLAVLLTHTGVLREMQNNYPAMGPQLTWFIGLPCWIMGCWLAESVERFPTLNQISIWALRGSIVAIAVVLRIIKFHVHSPYASNTLTLNLFAFLACFWLGCEIRRFEEKRPVPFLEWTGTWSYSVYLVHTLVPESITLFGTVGMLSLLTGSHLQLLLIIFVMSYLFHRVIEVPSHKLAVWVSRRMKSHKIGRNTPTSIPAVPTISES
ncbi:acyltransferase family protein [Terriglobus saanensis]|uniref:Acyltransferase 3 n=1 Tax=Terriglobus saanensis (strain ATCC BAA-1853 / DSM 23119 / SP1PR4) TaxID=401053 RepID=E8UXF5_TERSS|nr:acyltransferase [Terriglobus saanensis]ADV84179.1 acyltransferase 3 [Terriglobus saanensis SP1PR4]